MLSLVDFQREQDFDFNDDKWKFYRIILFFECYRIVLNKSFNNFYKENYLKNKNFYIYGSKGAFSRTILGELEKFSVRENIPLSINKINKYADIVINNSQKICSFIYKNIDNINIKKYLKEFEKIENLKRINKFIVDI